MSRLAGLVSYVVAAAAAVRVLVSAAGFLGSAAVVCGPPLSSPTASGKAALSRWRKGVPPAGRTIPWPADLRGTAASSTHAVLEVV